MMHSQNAIFRICQKTPLLRAPFTTSKRPASSSSPPRNVEPYILPRLVNDLDAGDSNYVRTADDPPARKRPSMNFIPKGVTERKEAKRRRAAFRYYNTTPADLWTYALRGLESSPTFSSHRLRFLARRKGLDPLDSADVVVAHLVDGVSTDAAENLLRAGFPCANPGDILVALRSVRWWENLHPMISMISSTTQGCEFLATHGYEVLSGIRQCRKAQALPAGTRQLVKVTSEMVLILLNNFRINAESKGVGMGAPLCNAGLYYAAQEANLPAIRSYLQTARQYKYAPDWRARRALRYLLQNMTDHHPNIQGEARKQEALELITGWEGGIEPRAGRSRSICFAYLAFGNQPLDYLCSIYTMYILGLGELGLSKALHAEWMSPDPNRMDVSLQGNEHQRYRSHLFAIAFILANDSQRALEVLESVPVHHRDASPLDSHGTVPPIWVPDWFPTPPQFSVASIPDDGSVWLRATIIDHYAFHRAILHSKPRRQLAHFLHNIPYEPQLALEALQQALPRELLMHKNRLVSPILDCSEEDGKVEIVGFRDRREKLVLGL